MNTKFLLTAVATLALSACATAPKPLQGQFSLVSPRDSVATQQVGTPVQQGLPGAGQRLADQSQPGRRLGSSKCGDIRPKQPGREH